jgi:uncharacterized repeat protein (TIGR03803 family)
MMAATTASSALADGPISVLYTFQAPSAQYTSPLGSQPDTLPVLGPGNIVYGMAYDGGQYGNGVIYAFSLQSQQYTVLHTFSALDPNGNNQDGATPGVALTLGPDGVLYGMASYGGQNGNGTIFKITTSGLFTVLHTFSALDANLHNEDGANPLRTVVIGNDGNLYGTTRLGGQNTCGGSSFDTGGCGVAWVMDTSGNNFSVLHQFTLAEGHAASLLQAQDGFFYGCAVWPATSTPSGAPLPSGILYRMAPYGNLEVLYTFSQTDANGNNTDGAGCYEPLVETAPGVFYGATFYGGTNGNGVVFSYSLLKPTVVEIVHNFSSVNAAGENSDGANPHARLTLGPDGTLYSTAVDGGTNGNGVVYSISPSGSFQVLHTFSATDPNTGANMDGAIPDYGVLLDGNYSLIGITDYGGNGSSLGFNYSGGTLYQLYVKTVAVANPKNVSAPQALLQLDGTASTSADGNPLLYQWSLAPTSQPAVIVNANTATPTVQFGGKGSYTFVLTVTDDTGTTATDSTTISH